MDRAGKRWLLVAQLTLALAASQGGRNFSGPRWCMGVICSVGEFVAWSIGPCFSSFECFERGNNQSSVQSTFQVTTPYSLYICPEGQNVTLTCKITAPFVDRHDVFYKLWYFSSQNDHSCSEKKHIRNVTERELHHDAGKQHGLLSNITAEESVHGQPANHHGLETSSDHHGTFHITMAHLTLQDSGSYCCYVIEAKKEHNKAHVQQHAHGFMELRIQKANGTFPNCTFHPVSRESENITAAALATGACIVGILCLPLILLLIYKQRQAITNRRMYRNPPLCSSSPVDLFLLLSYKSLIVQ
ncbi:UNVERIFIED_CONTAM: hypothetical protein K2H54_025965 [Gekko kuhli]